jgi:hypothetical protein
MTAPAWQLDRHHAQLQLAVLEGRIDLSRPGDGFGSLRLDRTPLDDGRLLGIASPSLPPGDPASIVECFVRGGDLVAVYRESQEWPIRVEARWRAGSLTTPEGPLGTLELAVAVYTEHLDSCPELSVSSVLPDEGVWRLADRSEGRFDLLARDGPSEFDADDGPGCLLFRLRASTWSYVEMVEAAGFFAERLQRGEDSGATVEVRRRLFAGRLEKGVLLRGRVSGAFLRREDDARAAARCCAGFAAAGFPLGT